MDLGYNILTHEERMPDQPKYVYGVVTSIDDKHYTADIIKRKIVKIDRGIIHLESPHPTYGESELLSSEKNPSYTAYDAVEQFAGAVKFLIEESERKIEAYQKLRELVLKKLAGMEKE